MNSVYSFAILPACYLTHIAHIKKNIHIVFLLHKQSSFIKGIVHFEIKIWYLSAYPKGIEDVGVFFSSVDPILMF